MTSTWEDKFDRADGDIGANYEVPCGLVSISDEAVIPVGLSGTSPDLYLPSKAKTQVLYIAEDLDSPDQVIRGVWARDLFPVTGQAPIPADSDPSFTLLARMSKDPLLVDLGGHEDPHCYDQGYGLRVTCPLDGSAPILKLVKFQPTLRPLALPRPASTEVDGATVLASITLQAPDLNVDPAWTAIQQSNQNTPWPQPYPYEGFWQDMRLRIRRADNMVILDAYLNDRHLNEPILSFTDKRDPLWGVVGRPGFDFLSAIDPVQPIGASPYDLTGLPRMRCGLFSTQTIKEFAQPVTESPDNRFTYARVVDRVIVLVEKNGDAKYGATTAGQTKLDTYLQFVLDAEAHILRKTGFWNWLRRESPIYLRPGIANYELPEDCGMIDLIRPGNFSGPPLEKTPMWLFRQRSGSVSGSAGPPRIYMEKAQSVNNRKEILLFPTPVVATQLPSKTLQQEISLDADPYIVVEYFARRVRPSQPDRQIPYIPQEHIDVLIWGGAAHGLILDTDPDNTSAAGKTFEAKLADLCREQYRGDNNGPDVARSVADTRNRRSEIPLTRYSQLAGFGWL